MDTNVCGRERRALAAPRCDVCGQAPRFPGEGNKIGGASAASLYAAEHVDARSAALAAAEARCERRALGAMSTEGAGGRMSGRDGDAGRGR